MSAFSNEKKTIDRKIVNSLDSSDDESDDIIEIDDDGKKVKFSKRDDDADMIENKNEYKKKYEKKYEKKKKKKKKKKKNVRGQHRASHMSVM